jgi:hypothetical protein
MPAAWRRRRRPRPLPRNRGRAGQLGTVAIIRRLQFHPLP